MSRTIHRRSFLRFATFTALLSGTAKVLSADRPSVSLPGVTPGKVSMRHAVIIGAPAETVYNAVTSQQGLSAWWTPGVTAKAERDSIARIPFGPDYFKEMRVTELEPSRGVKWLCITGVDEWVGTTISFDIQPGDRETMLKSHPEMEDQAEQQRNRDTQTLLTLSHDGWRGYTPMFAECNYTWGLFVRSLRSFCETGRGQPWPQQHRTAG